MKKAILLAGMMAIIFVGTAQNNAPKQNAAETMLAKDQNLTIGGYGEVHYNQPINSVTYNNGELDVHRMVMLLGYKFNKRASFVTELEFEHVKEVYVEQAFLDYKINQFINFRSGLLLIPMGITNEYHEPTTFNGVERPYIDKYVTPTTWREIGAGFTGNIHSASIRYQAYLVNGFNGYNGSAKLNGKNGLRSGRQKGAESYISSPNISAKLDYYGISGLQLGLSGYFGKSQSTLYDGISKDDNAALLTADSSVVGISMIGLDARFQKKGFQFRAQYYLTSLSNVKEYNTFATSDLGSSITGYYAEVGYNVLQSIEKAKTELIPFIRYEYMNMHNKVAEGFNADDKLNKNIITAGIGYKVSKNAIFKADIQMVNSKADKTFSKTFNAGIGVWF